MPRGSWRAMLNRALKSVSTVQESLHGNCWALSGTSQVSIRPSLPLPPTCGRWDQPAVSPRPNPNRKLGRQSGHCSPHAPGLGCLAESFDCVFEAKPAPVHTTVSHGPGLVREQPLKGLEQKR